MALHGSALPRKLAPSRQIRARNEIETLETS
jgi:hypothetical protein